MFCIHNPTWQNFKFDLFQEWSSKILFCIICLQNCYIISGPKCEKISRSKNFPPCLLTSVLSVLLLSAYVIASKMWIFLFVFTTFISKHSWPLPHIYELTNSLFHAKHLVGLELVWDAFLPPYFYQMMRNCSQLRL